MPSGIRRRKFKVGHSGRRKARKEKKQHLIHDNPVIAENWDSSLTLAQNYEKLGLASQSGNPAGGHPKNSDVKSKTGILPIRVKTKQARIERLDDGTVRVIEEDAVDIDEPIAPVRPANEIAAKLEEMAARKVHKPVFNISEDQQRYLKVLVAKYGDDYKKMQWDVKLNPFQYSAGDLKRKVKKYQAFLD